MVYIGSTFWSIFEIRRRIGSDTNSHSKGRHSKLCHSCQIQLLQIRVVVFYGPSRHIIYIAWNATTDSFPFLSTKFPTLKNSRKILRVWDPRNPIIFSCLLLDLTGLHGVLFLLSPVTCYLSWLFLLFDIIAVMSFHKVKNFKAPQCVIISIPITSSLLVPNNHQITSSSDTNCLVPSACKLWSSGQSFWLQIQRSRVRFPALPDFLSSSGSETGSTQPREVNWGATWIKK